MKYTITIAAMLFLTLCCSSPTKHSSGAQDFPNSMTVAMQAALRASKHYGEFDRYEQLSENINDSTLLGSYEKSKPLTKRRAISGIQNTDTMWWDYSDTVSGTATIIILSGDTTYMKSETLVVVYDENARDTIESNETVLYKVENHNWSDLSMHFRYTFFNDDSIDGFDHGVTELDFVREPEGRTRWYFYGRTGPDKSMESWLDNTIDSAAIFEYNGNDTISYNIAVDSDRDGVLWAYGNVLRLDTVDYRWITFVDTSDESLLRSSLRTSIQLHPTELQRSIPMRFTYTRELRSGYKERIEGGGFRADSTAQPGELSWLTIYQNMPESDSISDVVMDFDVVMDDEPMMPDARSVMTVLEMEIGYREGDLLKLELDFISDKPVVQTDTAASGDLNVRFLFRQGYWTYFNGRLEEPIIRGSYHAEDGKTYSIEIGPDGKVRMVN